MILTGFLLIIIALFSLQSMDSKDRPSHFFYYICYDIFSIVFPLDPPEATFFIALFTSSRLKTSSTDASIGVFLNISDILLSPAPPSLQYCEKHPSEPA